MEKHKLLRIIVIGLSVFFSGGITWAQVTTGTISGTVKDSSGAVLPGVQVVITNDGTGVSRAVTTDETGRYSALSLSLGNYRVTGTRDGFQTEVRSGIELTVGREAVVDLTLTVGAVTQTVEVQGEAPLVETTTASLGSLVDDRTIRALPLNGRSYDQLALLQPGVILTSPGQLGGAAQSFGTSKRFTVGGQRPYFNSFLLDGTNINDQANGTPGGAAGTNLGVDTILEFKIFTNSFKAEFGHSSGGVVSAVTRSGTNAFHGTAFEYIRNSVLDARNYFDTGSSPPPFRRNQFGGVLGGPIKRDKTFFFVGYEGLRQGLATTLTAQVPTALARQGILPTAVGATTTITVPVNPAIVPYLNLYPLPNGRDFGDGTAQYLSAHTVPTNEDNVMVRVDHQLNAKTSLFARYTFDTDSVNAQQSIPDVFIDQASRRQYTTLQANSVLSPKVFNNFRFAFDRSASIFNPVIDPAVPDQLDIIPGQPLGSIAIGAISAAVGGTALTPLGSPSSGSGPRFWDYNVFEWGDDFSYVAGKHSLKTGVDIQRLRDNTASGQILRGALTFPSFNAFLAGTPSSLQAASPLGVLPQWSLRQSLFAVYMQDDYTVNSRLTLNLGLRWETVTDPVDAKGQMSIMASPSASGPVISDRYFSVGKKNFEPRFGLAWRVNDSGKTVLRAGAGVYHNQILPWAYALNIFSPPFYGRFNASNPPFPNSSQVLKPGANGTLISFDPIQKTPVTDQYNLSIQQEIFRNTVIQVAYAGNHANHLQTQREADTATPIFCNTSPSSCPAGMAAGQPQIFYPTGAPRVNTAWNGIEWLEMNGNSYYNSATVTLRRQSSSGLVGQIYYTFAKAMDENSGVAGSDSVRSNLSIMDPYDISFDWGLADFDARHTLGANFSYPVPFRAGSKALGAVVNGWTLDGIATFQTGMPFTPRLSGSQSKDLTTNSADRPNLNAGFSNNPTSGVSAGCPGFLAGTPVGTPRNWFNPCAFSLEPVGTYGNLGRNTVIGPGIEDIDLALEKKFKVTEAVNVTFRAETFNIMNHPNFGLPNTTALAASGNANPSAGVITYTLTTSRQLQFALRISF